MGVQLRKSRLGGLKQCAGENDWSQEEEWAVESKKLHNEKILLNCQIHRLECGAVAAHREEI
jgi:hypothetical protein